MITARFGLHGQSLGRQTGALVHTLKGHTGPVSSASFSPDGSRLVTASHDITVKVWDAKTGAVIATLKGHAGPVTSASFSPDGSASSPPART